MGDQQETAPEICQRVENLSEAIAKVIEAEIEAALLPQCAGDPLKLKRAGRIVSRRRPVRRSGIFARFRRRR